MTVRRLALLSLLALGCLPERNFDGGVPPLDAGAGGGGGAGGGAPPPGWQVTLFSGSGTAGLKDGDAQSAQFNQPTGLAIDTAGNLYVADTGNRAIRRVDPSGNVITLSTGPYLSPQGVAVDGRSQVYVADTLDRAIWKLTSQGSRSCFAGKCGQAAGRSNDCADISPYAAGNRTDVALGSPEGLAFDADAGTLYYADSDEGMVHFVGPESGSGLGSVAGQGNVTAFVDGACGPNYCCGAPGDRLSFCCLTAGCQSQTFTAFRQPRAVAVASEGAVLVADTGNCALRVITTPRGTGCRVSTTFGADCAGAPSQSLAGPMGVAAGPNGVVYVSDTGHQRVVAIDPSQPLPARLSEVVPPGQLSSPWGLVVDARGRIYVVDSGHHAIKVLTPQP